MMAARPLSSSPSGTSHLIRDRVFWRSASLPPTRAAGRCPAPRSSASCASAAERERGFAGGSSCYYDYSYARSGSGGRGTAAAAAGGTLYDVLGLAAGATAQEIKAAYRKLARACHPDAAAGGRGGASADEFMRVHAAYATLSDPDKRAEYDRRLVAASLGRRPPSHRSSSSSASHFSATSPASSGSPPSSCFPRRRTWETDQCW